MIGLEARAEELASLAVEGEARLHALELAVSLLELTALQGTETPAAARELCATAARHRVAAMCVHPRLVGVCRERLSGSGVRVAAFATPAEARRASELGVDEVAIALDAASFLAGGYAAVVDEIAWVKDAVGGASLKVVLPGPALGGHDEVRRAATLATVGGADVVAESSGALPAALCILDALRDLHADSGRVVGFGTAGVAGADQAVRHLVLVHEALGAEWLTPARCRVAGPGLLEALLAEIGDTVVSV